MITLGKHLPVEPADFELPLRLHRLATVQGTIDGSRHANFIIDTGGEVISISEASANALGRKERARKIQLRVYGSSGWDQSAFLLPGVNLAFDADSVPELFGRRPESRHAERAPRIPGRRHRRPPVPEQLQGEHRSRAQHAAAQESGLG